MNRRIQGEHPAVKRGADELMVLLEWKLRNRPQALKNVRRIYRAFCVALYRRLEKARKRA